ncbi:MAG TPA: hypothetical protein DCX27_02775 [Balneola sp.]|nr:hypothetical protein [Balneola sp.]
MLTLVFAIICLLSLSALLWAEKNESVWGRWIFKIIASSAFVLIALTLADVTSTFSKWMIAGFVFSLTGVIFLIKSAEKNFFKIGIVSFAMAHIAFILAFVSIGALGISFYVTTLLALCLMLISYKWLIPGLHSEFKAMVIVYMIIIGIMCSLSGYAWEGSYRDGVLIGAFVFAISDLYVAREKFIKSEFKNKIIGLPLYYLAQIFLALSLDW